MKKTIQIKTNLLVILLLLLAVVVAVLLYLTNGVQNLVFASIDADRIDAVTVYEQSGERQALLSREDVQALSPLLSKVCIKGRSVRLFAAEDMGPQYSVRLSNGISFELACHGSYYIVNGRGYYVGDDTDPQAEAVYHNYKAIAKLYLELTADRDYFPRSGGTEVEP